MRHRLLVPIVAALLLAASPAAAAPPVRVAILPLVVHALDGHDYLRDGLADMLASRIGRVDGVSVVKVADTGSATRDAETAREAARQVGADFVVFGSFTRFGDGASLDLLCTETTSPEDRSAPPVRQVFVQSGTLSDIIPELDGVAAKIARFAATGGPPPVAAAPAEPGASGEASASAGPAAAQSGKPDDLESLRRRVEALEQEVFSTRQSKVVPEQDLSRHGLREGDGKADTGAAPVR